MDEDKCRLALLKLGFEPVQLLFTERADAGIEIYRIAVLGAAEKVVEVNELVSFIVENRVRLGIELGFEQAVAHLAGDVFDVVIMIAEAKVDGHFEPVRDGFGVIEASGIAEVEVIVGRRVVMEVVPDEEDLFDRRIERVDQISRRGKPWRRKENALIVFDAVLAALDVIVVDDVGICDKSEVEGVGRRGRPG